MIRTSMPRGLVVLGVLAPVVGLGLAPAANAAGPSNATLSSIVSTSGTVGSSVTDTATLTGATSDASGTILFTLFTGGACGGSVAFQDVEYVSSGAATSAAYTPLAAGTYSFLAVYSGDLKNSGATAACASVTLSKTTPTLSSSPNVTPPGTS
ncbi:MAG TPA: Ig-like domain repeat protein [Sporichthyaceae bacterium]|jgi:hypothetical protein|nr:Ig-like domain repeat protein [Sporichthyaceae bacterium]